MEKGSPPFARTLLNFLLALLASLAALAAFLAFLALMLLAEDSARILIDYFWKENQRKLCVRERFCEKGDEDRPTGSHSL